MRCATTALHSTQRENFETTLDCDAQPKTVYTYDVTGEQLTETVVNGAVTTTAVQGRTRDVTDGNGQHFVYVYDELGRLIQVTQPKVNGVSPIMTYTYDLADNLLKATGPGGLETKLEYDKLGRKTKTEDPDMGIWYYGYDGSGNLARQTDAKGQVICFYYDSAGRLAEKAVDSTPGDACPSAASVTGLATYTYYNSPGIGRGRLQRIDGGSGVGAFIDTFVYDYRGRVLEHSRKVGTTEPTFVVESSYDDADRLKTLTLPNSNSEVITYTYDGAYPQKLHSANKGGYLVNNLDYNFRGQLTKIDRAGAAVEDTVLTYHPASANFQLYQIKHGVPAEGIPDFWYTEYDPLGQLKKMETYYTGAVWENYTFTYDAVGRLASEKRVDSDSATAYHYTYTYGLGGNIATRKNESSGVARSYLYDNDDVPPDGRHYHALESVSGDGISGAYSYTNDANGNMTRRTDSGGAFTQAFDAENRLIKVTKEAGANDPTTEFYYDADGNRILTVYKTVNGQTETETGRVYTPFPEYEKTVPTTGSTTERIHYYLGGQYIAVRVKVGAQTAAYYFIFTDRQGSVAIMRKSDGSWVNGSTARYDAFGGYRTEPPGTVNPDISDRGYTGHRQNNTGDNDLGLIYMNARYYLPEVGRFISADTIVPDPKNPQSYNRYAYALNSPTNLIDPSGHDVCTADLSAVECSSGSNLAYVTAQPTRDFAYALAQAPFTPSSPTDPRVAELLPVICASSGCHFIPSVVPVYLASSTASYSAPRSEKQIAIGNSFDAAATSFDLSATAVSGSFVAAEFGSLALGGPGPDDGVIAAAYYQADKVENRYSRIAAGLVILGDFFSGESDISAQRLVIGQDTMTLGVATGAGELAGTVPILGPICDTTINLAVNVYDIGRLSGRVPNYFQGRFDQGRFYVVIYPH